VQVIDNCTSAVLSLKFDRYQLKNKILQFFGWLKFFEGNS
jgi:hypothetical protein